MYNSDFWFFNCSSIGQIGENSRLNNKRGQMSWLKTAVNKVVEVGNKNNITLVVKSYADSVVHQAGQAVAEGAKLLQDRTLEHLHTSGLTYCLQVLPGKNSSIYDKRLDRKKLSTEKVEFESQLYAKTYKMGAATS